MKRGMNVKSKNFSARLTIVVTGIFSLLLIAVMILFPGLMKFFFGYLPNGITRLVIIAFYCCGHAAAAARYTIFRVMLNVIRDDVFTKKTVFFIRLLSWCCLFVSVVCLVFGKFWPPLLIVSFSALFMTLILHVLKNVMSRATEIKEENDMTI